MRFSIINLQECSRVGGVVVVIDVLRAFSTACYAFAAGAVDITLVADVADAIRLKQETPAYRVIGEVGGMKVSDFDYGNSPAEMEKLDLTGIHLVQRTSSGTQGAVRANHASHLLAASFCCAQATARYIQGLAQETASFVTSGVTTDGKGDEDLALAEYLIEQLEGCAPNPQPYLERVTGSRNAELLRGALFNTGNDVELCARLDWFKFALPIERRAGRLVMKKFDL
jgi:2-phosphosulfolactate phosphatase